MKRILALALFALVTTAPASAQEWPTKTVRFVVPFGAGSTPDIIARLVSDKLQAKLGQSFIVENKAGAPTLQSRRRLTAEHQIEVVGEQLRAMMPWIKKNRLVDQSKN